MLSNPHPLGAGQPHNVQPSSASVRGKSERLRTFFTHPATAALPVRLGPLMGRILNAPGWLKRAAISVGAGLFGWALVFIHLRWFDRWYLAYGSRAKFQRR